MGVGRASVDPFSVFRTRVYTLGFRLCFSGDAVGHVASPSTDPPLDPTHTNHEHVADLAFFPI
jgi:hypothetical protein